MMIKAILACDSLGGIGKNGTLPWPKNSRDLKWFKENTEGHVVVMGSKTADDPFMPFPLPKRYNVVATSRPDDYPEKDDYINGNLRLYAPILAYTHPGLITWIIGGAHVLQQSLDVVDEVYLSRIRGIYDCDEFISIPTLLNTFKVTWEEEHEDVTFQIWKRK